MALLHVFSSFESFQRGISVIHSMSDEDSVLLRADALYQLVGDAQFGPRCHALKTDALARGLNPELFASVQWIDYADWVDLVVAHDASIDW
ncbi:hypothetical protein CWE09_03860 [Aliidiomarina minuta]|uniref:Sulfurtransferase complex subunit TusB n=1 Tax=Aliidiomarina minuta TaxID=880057 RepID=A0A432W762_9GAMM|nr:DsrH/TusB family sulfur metabolism protein [Aliidiomarina minuta]RUO25872.1 hypothetical protein CWE09_03860 [Aliidiomarina minuta]